MPFGARRAEYSGFVECKGGVPVTTRFRPGQACHVRRRRARRVLENHPPGRMDRSSRDDSRQGARRGSFLDERPWGIREDEIEWAPLRDASAQDRGVTGEDRCALFEIQSRDVCPDGHEGFAGRFDQNGVRGPPGQGFERQRSASGVKIEDTSPVEDIRGREDTEERLAHTVRGGSRGAAPRTAEGA